MTAAARAGRVRSRPAGVRVEALPGAVLLRSGNGAAGALRAVTSVLGRAHLETVVVTAPEVTARDDLFDVVLSAVAELDRVGNEVRLVLLGPGPDQAARQAGVRRIARDLGLRAIGSLGPVTVASDGTCVSVADPGADGGRWLPGWYGFGTGTGDFDEPPWSPRPRWPVPSTAWTGPGLVAHPVPAGLWLLPPGLRPGRAGVVGTLPREPDAATVFAGGCRRAVPVEALLRAVEGLRPDPASRLVLLPEALSTGPSPGRLDALPMRLRSAVPVLSRTGWRLAPVLADGGVAPVDAVAEVAEVPMVAAVSAAGEDPIGPPGTPSGPYTSGRRAVAGRVTAAGWSFVDGADALGAMPAVAGAVVEVSVGRKGFLVGGSAIGAEDFVDLLLAVLGPGEQPLVITGPGHARQPAVLERLATAWGSTVYASAGPLALTATGVLLAGAGFDAYRPGVPSEPVGPVLPVGCATAGLADLATRSTPPRAGRSEVVTASTAARAGFGGVARRLGGALAAVVRSAPGKTVRETAPVQAGPTEPIEPTEPTEESAADGPVSQAEPLAGGDEAAEVLADLGGLPVVFGPVYASAAARTGSYVAGQEVTAAGAVEARLVPEVNPAAEVEYVIWSMVGRRLDGTGHTGAAVAVFAPGSRFQVLGVEPADGRSRVYLVDLGAGRSGSDEELLARLRVSVVVTTDVPMIAPIGGREFTRQG
ncbi:hypothetical protein [Dactylosporangium sp. NPDC005555]|uniref:hypothetical protein n=1 Tax=Dactylosporangium sp. NPDC005555 TaxID=3154889 RepID=UPI0033B52707